MERQEVTKDLQEMNRIFKNENDAMRNQLIAISKQRDEYQSTVQTLLNEHNELRERDQNMFEQVCQDRNDLQALIEQKSSELTTKEQQLDSLALSAQELQQMVSALRGLAAVKDDMV